MPLLGTHVSIAGGFAKAVERAEACGAECLQIFTANPRSLQPKKTAPQSAKATRKASTSATAYGIPPAEAEQFQAAMRAMGIQCPIAHDSYLINLASSDRDLWRLSVDAFIDELLRAETLGIPYVVTHPGAFTSGTEDVGLQNIIQAIDEIHATLPDTTAKCLLETTSGQGTTLGWRFEQLARILNGVKQPDRLGVCFDTCHVFAAGYPMGTARDYKATMNAFDRLIGLERIKAFHLNDSLRPLGSRKDRHEHIGQGQMGLEPFRFLVNDARFRKVPMYLETPKGEKDGVEWDVVNLQTLRQLMKRRSAK